MAKNDVPTYTDAERERRWNLARSFMDAENVDALIVFGEHEDAGPATPYFDNWFTNGRPGSTIVFPRDEEPIELAPYHVSTYYSAVLQPICTTAGNNAKAYEHTLTARQLSVTDHLESSRRGDAVWTKPKNFRMGRDAATLVDVLNEFNLGQSTVGVVGLDIVPPWFPDGLIPYSLWTKVVSQLPQASFKSVGESFSRLVMVQSDEELAVVRYAAMAANEMCQAMVQAARPGVKEHTVVAAGVSTAYNLNTHVPLMHLWSGPELVASGIPPWSYRPQASRTLQEGDVVHAEVFGQFGLRSTQSQMMVAIGEVHPDIERAAAIARECYDAGLRTLKPGVSFGDVCEKMLKPVLDAGGYTRGPQIHSLNPLYALCGRPTKLEQLGGAERYCDVGTAPTILADLEIKAGMTFAFEPSCAFGRHLVTLGGSVIVGEDGPIELNSFTAQLHRISTK